MLRLPSQFAVFKHLRILSQVNISDIEVGTRVAVPFRNKTTQGVVVSIKNINSYNGPTKQIIKPVDKVKIITPSLWKLIKWVSKYYMTPLGKVANSVVPQSLSIRYAPQVEKYVKVFNKVDLEKLAELKKERLNNIYYIMNLLKVIQSVKFPH